MADNKQHDTRTTRRPDCVTEIRMGNSVLVVSGYFKKDTTTTAADKMARVLEAEAAASFCFTMSALMVAPMWLACPVGVGSCIVSQCRSFLEPLLRK